MDELTLETIAAFDRTADAEIARGNLEALGIGAFVDDAEMATILPVMVGGAKLRVRQTDAAEARNLLAQWRSRKVPVLPHAGSKSNDDIRCFDCGATMPEGDVQCAACGWSYQAV